MALRSNIALPAYSDTASDAPEGKALAVDFTLSPGNVIVSLPGTDLGAWSLGDPALLIGITGDAGQWSTASWNSSCAQIPHTHLYDNYSSASSEISIDGSEWSSSGTDSLFFGGDALDPGYTAMLSSYPGELPLCSSLDELSALPSFDGPCSSEFLDGLSPLPFPDDISLCLADPATTFAQGNTLPTEAHFRVSDTPSEDPTLERPPARKNRYHCPYPQCRRIWKTAQALAYAPPTHSVPDSSTLTLVYSQHKRCHTKRYACKDDRCRTAALCFGTRRDLDRHQSAVHMGERQKCPQCGKMVKRQDNLARHISTVHKTT
jgi:hypothetical protein